MALKFSWSMIYLMEMKVNRTDEKFVGHFFLDFFSEMVYNICINVPKPALERAALRCPAGRRKKR